MNIHDMTNKLPSSREIPEVTSTAPRRFVGPFTHAEAEELIEDALDDIKTRKALLEFLIGDTEPKEFVYCLQLVIESWADLRFNSPKNEMEDL
jgi:hypothetical protein